VFKENAMKRLYRPLFLAFAMLLPATPALAASEVLHFSFQGQSAGAAFESVDSSGCITTTVFVFAADGKVKIDGQAAVTSGAALVIDVIDLCNLKTTLVSAFGSATLAPDDFVMQKLDSATLDTSIEVFDSVSEASFTVDLSVTWTGVGDQFRTKGHSQVKTPSFKLNSRFDSTSRSATASGTVSDGTTNFTPDPALSASLDASKSGDVSVVKL
jgi:hypothetical protein